MREAVTSPQDVVVIERAIVFLTVSISREGRWTASIQTYWRPCYRPASQYFESDFQKHVFNASNSRVAVIVVAKVKENSQTMNRIIAFKRYQAIAVLTRCLPQGMKTVN